MSKGIKTSTIMDRLKSMNNHFGRGDIVSIAFDGWSNDTGEVTRQPFKMRAEKRRFRISNGVLYFLGHQSTLAKPFRL